MDDVRLLRISEVAELLRISRTKVDELVTSGQIPRLHLGRIRRALQRSAARSCGRRSRHAAIVVAQPSGRGQVTGSKSPPKVFATRRIPLVR